MPEVGLCVLGVREVGLCVLGVPEAGLCVMGVPDLGFVWLAQQRVPSTLGSHANMRLPAPPKPDLSKGLPFPKGFPASSLFPPAAPPAAPHGTVNGRVGTPVQASASPPLLQVCPAHLANIMAAQLPEHRIAVTVR